MHSENKYLYVKRKLKVRIRSEVTCDFKSRKIYTFNFHRNTNPGDLKVFFNKFGPVQEVCIRKCKNIHQGHDRFAFVIFEEIDSAFKAVNAEPSELELNGYTLQVRNADSNTKLKQVPSTERFQQWKKERCKRKELTSFDRHIFKGDVFAERKDGTLMTRKEVNSDITKLTSVDGSEQGGGNIGINDLNDDCLFHIFSYFNMRQKIRLELVCKRWRCVLLDQWKMTTYLNFEKEHHFKKLNADVLKGLLEKCGPSIQKVDLPQYHSLRRSTVYTIASCCIQLRHLSLQNLSLSSKDIQALVSNCKNLKSLELKRPLAKMRKEKWEGDGRVQNLTFLQGLKELPLESFVYMNKRDNGKFLTSLPQNLKNLELNSCEMISNEFLLSGLSKLKNLQSFKISKGKETLLLGEEFYSKISNVEEFGATQAQFTYEILPLHNHLHNLRKLSLKCSNLVDDFVLAEISQGCKKLEVLDISGCEVHPCVNQVSDLGIGKLVKHCVLTDLSIRNCPNFTDFGLSILANAGKLKKLSCEFCQRITDDGCSQVISLCPELELLNVNGCRKITSVIIASAMSTVSIRSKEKTLHMFVIGTRILSRRIPKANNLLQVHYKMYSKKCANETARKPKFRGRIRSYNSENEYYMNLLSYKDAHY